MLALASASIPFPTMTIRLSTARLRPLFPTTSLSTRQYATLFKGQPHEPYVQTDLPGPLSIEGRAKLGRVFDTGAMRMLVDYEHSLGNQYVIRATFYSQVC